MVAKTKYKIEIIILSDEFQYFFTTYSVLVLFSAIAPNDCCLLQQSHICKQS